VANFQPAFRIEIYALGGVYFYVQIREEMELQPPHLPSVDVQFLPFVRRYPLPVRLVYVPHRVAVHAVPLVYVLVRGVLDVRESDRSTDHVQELI